MIQVLQPKNAHSVCTIMEKAVREWGSAHLTPNLVCNLPLDLGKVVFSPLWDST